MMGPLKPRNRTGRRKRKLAAAKTRNLKLQTKIETYDLLALMAGPKSLVETVEELVEREFDRRLKRAGLLPIKNETAC